MQSQYRSTLKVEEFFEYARIYGQEEAEKKYPTMVQRRITQNLLSGVSNGIGLSIRRLTLDESQYAKNERNQTHQAIKALSYSTSTALSGNFVANKWLSIFWISHLLPGENPFPMRRDFHRVFGKERNRIGDPPPNRLNRLVKLPMAMTMARP